MKSLRHYLGKLSVSEAALVGEPVEPNDSTSPINGHEAEERIDPRCIDTKQMSGGLGEAFDANDYLGDENAFYQALSAAILDFVADKFGGKAWFKGGSYAYKVDVSNPNVLTASDGSVVKVEGTLASTLEDYSERYAFNDFVDSDSNYWDEFFRPVKDPNRLAKDGAPMHGSDQAEHEYNNMMGESIDAIKRLAGLK